MISRRRILSRSRDELMMNGANGNGNGNQYPDNYNPYEDEEDVWYSKDKLMKVGGGDYHHFFSHFEKIIFPF